MNNVYYNFVIVGCGGTGGNFAGKLAQFISTAGTLHVVPSVWLMGTLWKRVIYPVSRSAILT